MIQAKEAIKLTKAARKKVEEVKAGEIQVIKDYVSEQIKAAAEAGNDTVKIYFEMVENGLDLTYQKIIRDALTDAGYLVYRIFNNTIEIDWQQEWSVKRQNWPVKKQLNEDKK